MKWKDARRGIHDLFAYATGLAGNRIIWSKIGAPEAKGDHVSLTVSKVDRVGEDFPVMSDSSATSEKQRLCGHRNFMLNVQSFGDDAFDVCSAIQGSTFLDVAFDYLKKQEGAKVVIDTFVADITYLIDIEDESILISSEGLVSKEELRDKFIEEINANQALIDQKIFAQSEAFAGDSGGTDSFFVIGDYGSEFEYSTEDPRLTLTTAQGAVDVAYISDGGMTDLPQIDNENFDGRTVLDVVFSTHVSTVEDMVAIEKVDITGDLDGLPVNVSVDIT